MTVINYYHQGRPEMVPFVPTQAQQVLEIGCGGGGFIASLKASREGVHAVGIEAVPSVAEQARKVFDEVLALPVEQAFAQLGERRFDCVVANDLLEHLVDPWAVLRLMSGVLAPGGCVVASIPNVRHWPTLNALFMQGRWDYADAGILDRTHLRFFTRKSLPDLFGPAGLRLERVEGINASPLPWKIQWVNRLLAGRFDDTRFQQFACVARV